MADGLNEARALRVTELMRDFQSIQQRIAAYSATTPAGAQNEAGFLALKQCKDEARALLSKPPPAEPSKSSPPGSDDAAKRGLQSVIMDASARRFRAQRIFLRATAAMKWINARAGIVTGAPKPADQAKLKAISDTMKQIKELNSVTDTRIYNALRSKDQTAGFWLADDPSLNALVTYMKSHA